MSNRRRRSILIAIAAAGLLGVWLLRRGGGPRRALPPGPAPTTSAVPRPGGAGTGRKLPPGEPAPAATAPSGVPIIDEVVLEKSEVCEGEENLVTVEAHTPEHADDAFLHYLIAGKVGNPAVLRGHAGSGREDLDVVAFGRNGAPATAEVPPFKVKDCKAPYQLLLAFRLLPNRASAFEFTAQVRPFGAREPFRAARYLWSFGDGTTMATEQPVATHDFSRRPQREVASTFLIGCVAVSGSRQRVEGRVGIELHNLAFESFAYKGVVKIFVEADPLFPALDADGRVTQRVRLWHAHDSVVRIEGLRRTKLVMGAAAAASEAVPARALGVASIAPGEVAASKPLTLDTKAEPGVYSVEYLVEGRTEDGWPAKGNFAIMRPTPPPTPEQGAPVADPVLKAKILRARELLGQAYVTDEEIWRLDREGAFDGLKIDPRAAAPPTAAAPPRPRPPAPQPRGGP